VVVKDEVAPETAFTASSAAAEPIPQRKMMAKLEPAAGLVTMFRKSGSSCNAAARNKGSVRVSRFINIIQTTYGILFFS
jgi:hypothetical protein